jgi:predicted N-acyltransferase
MPDAAPKSMPVVYDYIRVVSDLGEIDAAEWDSLVARSTQPTPFLKHAFLHALHETDCAAPESGWSPQYLTLWRATGNGDGSNDVLVGAAPLYVKGHSYGEYVFDWAWANAYADHGLQYYPKLLVAVPFTPVEGSRLIADDAQARARLLEALLVVAKDNGMSSLHVLFPSTEEAAQLADAGLLMREGVQFHWTNEGYADFEHFLSALEAKKRKNIRAERRKVAQAGISFRHVRGQEISDADWELFSRCYRQTYLEHRSTPYLNHDFFLRIGATMPEHLLLIVAQREGRDIAASLLVVDEHPTRSTLYGRYWGALEHHPCLHFETAYYQSLEWCIANGIRTFEGGAQGEHKMARGFMPVRTQSAHWLARNDFADAIERFLARERPGIRAYVDELNDHSPFRST